MRKKHERLLAFVLCFTLTLGAFAYRPPQAKAVAAEASALSALLYMWMSGAGVQFTNSGLDSSAIVDALNPYIVEFEETVKDKADSFVEWLGYDSYTDLVKDIPYIEHKVFFPRPVALKLNEFTEWIANKWALSSDASSNVSAVQHSFTLEDGSSFVVTSGYLSNTTFSFDEEVWFSSGGGFKVIMSRWNTISVRPLGSATVKQYGSSFGQFDVEDAQMCIRYYPESDVYRVCLYKLGSDGEYSVVSGMDWSAADFEASFGAASLLGLLARLSSLLDIPEIDESAKQVPLVVDSDAVDLAALLEELLEKIAANEALGISVDTDTTGGETGDKTDDDAKPYLPYIPKIFERIGELPNLIAEKIGAFFTTLWGWLQKIIDAILSIPAMIAEGIKDLFVPHDGYAAEFVDELTATYEGRMGLLTYPFTVLANFVNTVATLEEQEPILRWDDVIWKDKKVITAGEYNLKAAISGTHMQTVYTIYQTVVSAVLVVAFLHLCYKKLKEVQHN